MNSSRSFADAVGQPRLQEIVNTLYEAHDKVFELITTRWSDDLCDSLLDLVVAIRCFERMKKATHYN